MSKTNYHIIGLGGAGATVVEYFQKKGIEALFTCITNPIRDFHPSIRFIEFNPPKKLIAENSNYLVSDLNQTPVLTHEMKDLIFRKEYPVIIAGLGQYTGTFLAQEMIKFCEENGKEYIGIFSTPFSFESAESIELAKSFTNNFRSICIKYFDLNELKKESNNLTLSKVFESANEQFLGVFKLQTDYSIK